ncbi:MAG: hypothetical protein KF760_27530 [Candidatus Eremiobacteraeota bacterium]|nr:hypothetical protein [Candidatus Eremiobacteraeota bacterium]MCW5872259.1 hypothetical protein [Candidatus Eremiobacteraeota bacterium]
MPNDEMPYTDITYDATSPKRELARLRDELRLQVHLARAEVRSQWEELEKKWTLLQSRLSVLEVAGEESKREIGQAVRALVQELNEGYARMRGALARV